MSDSIRVLHVEDDPDVADLTADFLEAEDGQFTVETAQDAKAGLELIDTHSYDCIVSDFDMPGATGIEFLRTIRGQYPDLPFILYTGKGSEEVASEAISAGVTDYLQKGVGHDQYKILANRILNSVERARAQQARQAMRERMELALDKTQSVVYEIDLQTRSISREGDFHRLVHQSEEDLRTLDVYLQDAVHPEDQEGVTQFYQEFFDGGRQRGEYQYRTNPDAGPVRWIEISVFVDQNEHEESSTLVGLARDVTDRVERTEELRMKERRYEAIFNDPNILVGLIDVDGTVLDINQTAMEYIDESLDAVTGQPFWETPWFGHSDDLQEEVEDWIDRARNGEYVEFEADLERPDGTPYTIEGVFRPVLDDNGEVVSLIISDRDVTTERTRRGR